MAHGIGEVPVRLACVGNALYDVVAFVETDFASRLGFHAGSTVHLDRDGMEPILSALAKSSRGAGGGAVNTAKVFASLGHGAAFAGMVGDDELGTLFRRDLEASGIASYLQVGRGRTGAFCAMIAPDGERTIAVAPELAPRLDPSAIPDEFFASDSTMYVDGFIAANPDALRALTRRAADSGMGIALDVAGYRIAVKHRDLFLELIRSVCSWTFMNEDEFIALSQTGVDEGLKEFSASAPGTVIVKRAETGAVCVSDGHLLESAVRPIRATDTTGAGDAFAAGFLSAALRGEPLARCLRLGNRVAEQAIQVTGMALDADRLQRAASTVL
ncbi:MAG TPA: adenosine kinase [Spirochaetales bacterium]|nr:adenosine kinase [Spirochaetales bacterium]